MKTYEWRTVEFGLGSMYVCIPSKIVKELNIQKGQTVRISIEVIE